MSSAAAAAAAVFTERVSPSSPHPFTDMHPPPPLDSDAGVGYGLLALVLLAEKSRGTASSFAPYIASLPTMAELSYAAWLWPADAQAALLPLNMAGEARALLEQVHAEHRALLDNAPAVCDVVGACFSIDEWLWAQAAVRSRAFPLPITSIPTTINTPTTSTATNTQDAPAYEQSECMALWPGIDHGNHSPAAAFGTYFNADTREAGLMCGCV
jgi:hypothetical protein